MARIEINLLPRELRKKRSVTALDRRFAYVAALAVGLVVLFVGASIYQGIKLKALDAKIADAQRRTDQLKSNIQLVDALTQLKDKILQRISTIETLDRSRAVWVRVLEDLSKRVPDYLWLSLLREEESGKGGSAKADSGKADSTASFSSEPTVRRVTIEGYSYSLNSLAAFLIHLTQSQYFKNMELEYVKRAETKQYKTFSFQLIGDLYYLPDVEGSSADTAAQKLALGSDQGDADAPNLDSPINLASGRK
ncbi:MAG: PilN domain-containing protein [Candidatus Zixiibacteriota bacterium]